MITTGVFIISFLFLCSLLIIWSTQKHLVIVKTIFANRIKLYSHNKARDFFVITNIWLGSPDQIIKTKISSEPDIIKRELMRISGVHQISVCSQKISSGYKKL